MFNFKRSKNMGWIALISFLLPVGSALFADSLSSTVDGSQSLGVTNSNGSTWSGSVRKGEFVDDLSKSPAKPLGYDGFWQMNPPLTVSTPDDAATNPSQSQPNTEFGPIQSTVKLGDSKVSGVEQVPQTPLPQGASSQLPVAPAAAPSAAQPSASQPRVDQAAGQQTSQPTQTKKNAKKRKDNLKPTHQGKRSEKGKATGHYSHSQQKGKRNDKRMERHERRTEHQHQGSQDKRRVYR